MKILIVDNHTKNLESLKKLISIFDFSIVNREDFSVELTNDYDLIIFSGGSGVRSVKNHKEIYQKEIDFIQNTDKKIIGICLGCEIIATAFDCTLRELKLPEKGITNIKLNNKKNQEIKVYESHRFTIDQVSDKVDILAISEYGIEMIKHKTKAIYGLQFHPEMFVNETQGREVFFEILNKMSKTVFDINLVG